MAFAASTAIVVRGAREHNLQDIDIDIPRDQLVVITGLSGSGKSTLAFDTLYAEGQRRFLESLGSYARQYLGMLERPDVDRIDGLSPVIAIEQKTVSRNPRSTVGTVTEIYDYLRLLYARAGTAHSPVTGKPLRRQSVDEIIDGLQAYEDGTKLVLLAPVVKGRKGHYAELFEQIQQQGYVRARVDGKMSRLRPGKRVHRYKTHDIEVVVDRLQVSPKSRPRLAQGVEQALAMGSGVLIAGLPDGTDRVFSRHLYDPDSGLSYDEPSPNTFSFNTPYGACPECSGLGITKNYDPDLVLPVSGRSLRSVLDELTKSSNDSVDSLFLMRLEGLAKLEGFSLTDYVSALSEATRHTILHGSDQDVVTVRFKVNGRMISVKQPYDGLLDHLRERFDNIYYKSERVRQEQYMRSRACAKCNGSRLKADALNYRVGGKSIAELGVMDLFTLATFFRDVEFGARETVIATPILKEIRERLAFMVNVGVGYLALDREARSLSGGEAQRIRLAAQIGTQLTGVLYVLDEPSIGLHARDNRRLIASLCKLRDMGNSVIVVEHDREMIEAADFVVDLGPGAGEHGGHVVGAAPPTELPRHNNGFESLTMAYLTGDRQITVGAQRRKIQSKWLRLHGAVGHNLRGDSLRVPIGLFVCVTGVSGSGKSSLINQTLYPALSKRIHGVDTSPLAHGRMTGIQYLNKVIEVDQKPIGRTPRSNPATYTKLFTPIRDLFASLPEAKVRGYVKGRFSFNVKGGRCEECKGAGVVKLAMKLLPDVYVECEECSGLRYNRETLKVRFKGKNISEVLAMRVDEAREFFKAIPRIHRVLETLHSVGLGYIRIGQPSTTISGGEAQRIKLSRELARPGKGGTLYILDEPTTGLHFEDIRHLLQVLQALVDKGNTVLVIEHNMDVIKVADYVIDLGPEGGEAGGHIVFSGRPEKLAKEDSDTGRALKVELERSAALASR